MRFIKACFRPSLTSRLWKKPVLQPGILCHSSSVRETYLKSAINRRPIVSMPDVGNVLTNALTVNTRPNTCKYHKHQVDDCQQERDVVSVKPMPDHIVIKVRNGEEIKTSGMWLRDHCRCDLCYSESRNQSLYDPGSISSKPTIVELIHNENEICVEWDDGHRSAYETTWIMNCLLNKRPRYPNKQLWNVEKIKSANISMISYKDYMNETDALAECLRNLYTYGLAFVDDVPVNRETLIEISERISFLRECEHGKDDIFVSTSQTMYKDIAFTNQDLGFHADSAYNAEPPGYLVFHMTERSGEGGHSRYVDGYYVAESIRQHRPDAYGMLSQVLVEQELKDKGVHYVGKYPVFTVIDDEVKILRYQPTDRRFIPHLSLEQTELFYDSLRVFYQKIYSPENEYWLKLQPGRVLLLDNYRLLHGRSKFTGSRVLRNTVLPRDEVDSRIRVLTGLG
ncbi:trimethyllysine dioxygenase, mitochondrial-like [Anneissia japonica]|uniref:trimethyllysine dioxygenase, mitochondrial-like n=1 Tax=Anneissia japonica TaxID=1529436 RepID=UPI00142551E6|nr:trimethyllysine dioxygenase, mitochondrial-like [Anneissia japonica]